MAKKGILKTYSDLKPVDKIRLLEAHSVIGSPHGRFEEWLRKKKPGKVKK